MNIAWARNPLRLLIAMVAMLAIAALAGSASSARADTSGPITFESTDGYAIGNINGQNGWSMTGAYDVAVADNSTFPAYGFGGQSLRLSDAVTSGGFGDQTFAPLLTTPANEATTQRFFNASFKIGSTSGSLQPGMHMSVSPDNGQGARMSYLRFEDQADGIHVFFDGVTDTGPDYTQATFSDTDIATLSRTTAHTVGFSLQLVPGAGTANVGNDVVRISIDGNVVVSGTSWENYYRFDNENHGGIVPPGVSTMLFRESGTASGTTPGNLGGGFLVDNLSYASTSCMQTGFMRDGINLTAAQIGGTVTGSLDASGCNIGAYNPTSVSNANISGANYYGVVDNGITTNITNSSIHNIGEVPFNGTQHGNAVLYINGATGTISGSTVSQYQKNGITVSGKAADGVTAGPTGTGKTNVSVLNNTVTGQGHISYIAQNGIQISYGATAIVRGDTVSGNWYTPAGTTACGLLLYQAAGVKTQMNSLFDNETNLCNVSRGGGHTNP